MPDGLLRFNSSGFLVMDSPTVGWGDMSSGCVLASTIASGAVWSGHIVPGQVGRSHLASGSVSSGALGVGGLPTGGSFLRDDFTWSSVGLFTLLSGVITAGSLGSGAVVSGNVASGQIGTGHLADGAVRSGDIASGQVTTCHLGSGTRATTSQYVAPIASGSDWTLLAAETISGVRAVALTQLGGLQIAMASVSGRMPAIGVIIDNVLSGTQTNVLTQGMIQASSGMINYSGYLGKRVWVGRSGHIVTLSGSFGSGGYLSGDLGQPLGYAVSSGGFLLQAAPFMASGGPIALRAGGPY